MRIVHVLHELPYPANSGIRCDMARRLEAFAALGHRVFAIAWTPADGPTTPEAITALKRVTQEIALLPVGRDLPALTRRLWQLWRHPSYIASRIPIASERRALIARVRDFAPDVIWLEGVHPSWLALKLQRELGVPLLYRSHNIEHLYLAEQARLARSARQRLALTVGTWGLEQAERAVHAQATCVFDISADDLLFWRDQGFANTVWLAPQPDPAILAAGRNKSVIRDIDLLFVGSLSSPNNIVALQWYLRSIHPLVAAELPDVRLLIAGRAPSTELTAQVRAAGAELIADPADVAPLFARGRVMLNPILHGSGMNIKTVDMLATGRPVVTTAKGARGLPDVVKVELEIVDDPVIFANTTIKAVTRARAGKAIEGDRRLALIERVFGHAAVAAALAPFGKRAA